MCPRSSACATSWRPVPPVDPTINTRVGRGLEVPADAEIGDRTPRCANANESAIAYTMKMARRSKETCYRFADARWRETARVTASTRQRPSIRGCTAYRLFEQSVDVCVRIEGDEVVDSLPHPYEFHRYVELSHDRENQAA